MDLKSRLSSDSKAALKAHDRASVSALRLILAAIRNEELKDGRQLDDAGVIGVLSTLAKQRRESIEAYAKGGREELKEREENELALIERYLPAPLSGQELERIVDEGIAQVGAQAPKDMGNVMREVMPRVAGRADGKVVSEIVRRKLSP